MKTFFKIAAVVFFLVIAAAGAAASLLFWAPLVPKDSAPRDFVIHRGMALPQIADSLQSQGLISSRGRFIFADRILQWGKTLKAGKYTITPGASTLNLYKLFRSGKSAQFRVTLPEGKTIEDYAAIFQRTMEIDSAAFVQLAHDSTFAKQLNVPAKNLEGYLYPNTYSFAWGVSAPEVIRTIVQEFHQQVDDSLRRRAAALGMSLHEVVTLASIIEGEAVVDSERTIISAVYHNRLRQGILLQADPTIQYIVPGPPRRLLNRHLEIDSRYNTYRYPGLPPGPVNNPGIASIRAALYPANADYIYFVARGDGSHTFSRTLQEHLRAKKEFDKIRARVQREKRQKSQPGG
ncbi:MAG: endolytic transglycosylase MltG [candidate division KSB1 bacterium]|nr:endolytic transglycosylase MltG [candidate division KSB1 bacterium]MDZ7367536.1 endolytic transglycosylase MltG [candidate division KSB1 bacterium]MDZ7404906.1 endolytic transglycosylase MltG [candidate division KSB1 bacterium]